MHLLELSLVSEGAVAMVVTNRMEDIRTRPVYVLSGATEVHGSFYVNPPVYEEVGSMGADAAARAFADAGIDRADVDVFELYDPTAFEVIRQFEALGYCAPGEGGAFVEDGRIALGGTHPTNTDGGLLSHAHLRIQQMTQKVIEATQQLRGECGNRQVDGAQIALVTSGGPPAGFYSLALLGADPG
jgi:acetyl-CoA acetyltransferase